MRTGHKRIIATALLLFVMLGFLSFATGVRTVTTSSVTLITVTATKIYTTTMVMGGEVAEMTVEHPSAVRIFLEKRSD